MSEIIGVIDGIAFQTNILALNAAVEAAREIRDLIQTSVGQVESSASLIRSAGEGISAMAGGIHSVAASMSEIASSSNEQSTGLKEISGAV
ncbi:methyl-accepting chemotaxis protein, partial [Acinetobacter baumannii]